ncbi:uncharacterized protein LOC113682261 isoform X1 [Pocillopora damicornis]|uniref:uncharacterized protein LOC113682261 isoform X1 n=1 Tax=Pocillopora damicornis TaxID=46731 RepID=UPI000F559BBA|nr:uncharacterized protein LOC113682261 isoform X1 [Pocillopora damicornis]
MSRSVVSPAQAPIEVQDDSVATTLKVIMDVLKSHEGSIKELRNFLTSHGKSPAVVPPLLNIYDINGEEEPVKDLHTDDIPDNQSEASSIMSSRTEYHELPTRSTLINSTGISSAANGMLPLSDLSHQRTIVSSPNGLTSTPAKPYSSPQHFPQARTALFEQTPKLDLSVSTVHADEHQGKISSNSSQPYNLHMPPVRSHKGSELHKYSPSPSSSYSVVALSTKIQLLENQVSEWGDIIDEMSDRMANQPSLIRKFAKESTTDKVSYRQHTDDLEELERKLAKRIDDKFASLDRKIIELYDDLMSQVSHTSASKVSDEKKTGKQDSLGKLHSNVDSLSEQFAKQNEKVKHIAKGMSELDDKVAHLKQDMSLYRRQVDGNKRGDDELVSLVAEQLIGNEDITGWKVALKEIHAALNKQSEINTSVHHSYATLDKRTEAMSQKVQLHGRWRWSGVSNLYPRAHSCVADQHTDDINFTSQIHNTESRSLVWEKGKSYVVITTGGCYWLSVGAFSRKTTTPPSLQVTIDEEPVPLFNSSGKSPTHHRISVISSAPKYQPSAARLKGEGTGSWRPGSILTGAVLIPAHSRISISPTSTAPGTRLSVEGYLELLKMY